MASGPKEREPLDLASYGCLRSESVLMRSCISIIISFCMSMWRKQSSGQASLDAQHFDRQLAALKTRGYNT